VVTVVPKPVELRLLMNALAKAIPHKIVTLDSPVEPQSQSGISNEEFNLNLELLRQELGPGPFGRFIAKVQEEFLPQLAAISSVFILDEWNELLARARSLAPFVEYSAAATHHYRQWLTKLEQAMDELDGEKLLRLARMLHP